MKNCTKCHHQFTYQDKFRACWNFNESNEVICPKCGAVYYISNQRMWKVYGLLLFFQLIVILMVPLFKVTWLYWIGVVIFVLLALVFIFLATIKIVEKKDGLLDKQF